MKKKFKKNDIIVVICLIIVFIISLFVKSNVVLTVISLCGIVYSYLIAKGSKLGYLFGVINVTLYGIMLFISDIYGGAIYNLFYGLPILIYGYYYWSNKRNDDTVNSLKIKGKIIYRSILILTIISTIIIFVVKDSIILSLDILTTILGFVGMFFLANKYKEQWPVWILCNLANTLLWVALTITSINNISVMLMWFFYFINSIYGYINWNKKTVL